MKRTYAAGVNFKLSCLRKVQGRKYRLYPKRDDLTYPRKKDEHRQDEMQSKYHGEVNRSVPQDIPDDSSKLELLHRRRG